MMLAEFSWWFVDISPDAFVSLVRNGLFIAAVVGVAALGELFVQRAGLVNVGVEGLMLVGAFFAFLASFATGSPWLGLLAGIAAGVTFAALFALLCVTWNADQIVAGLGLNMLALGVTSVFVEVLRESVGHGASFTAASFSRWDVPLLADIPFVGPMLFSHFPLVYAAIVISAAAWWTLNRTWWGLAVRAIGEHPAAADTVGIAVKPTQFICVLIGGALAGLAGSQLSIGYNDSFHDNMTSGWGFIALALVVFGRWRVIGIAIGTLLFGLARSYGDWLATQPDITSAVQNLIDIVPYALTLLALGGFVGRADPPAHLALPYRRH
jgi:ABC-type uncharacterized transport system permease subunit